MVRLCDRVAILKDRRKIDEIDVGPDTTTGSVVAIIANEGGRDHERTQSSSHRRDDPSSVAGLLGRRPDRLPARVGHPRDPRPAVHQPAKDPGYLSITYSSNTGAFVGNLIDIARAVAPILMISVGMCLVIATGGIDLSVGSIMAVAGAVSMEYLNGANAPDSVGAAAIALVLAVLLCSVLGARQRCARCPWSACNRSSRRS